MSCTTNIGSEMFMLAILMRLLLLSVAKPAGNASSICQQAGHGFCQAVLGECEM